MPKIIENDNNINIPRYIDMLKEEEPMDIEAEAQENKTIDKEMAKTDKTIADFCKELGKESPF